MDEQNTVAAAATEETQTQSAAEATATASAQSEAAATAKAAEAAAPEANAAPDAKPAAAAAKDDKAAPAAKAAETAATGTNAAPATKAASEEGAIPAHDEIAALQQRLAESELRSAAALAGVPRERVPYVARMADVSGIDPADKDAADRYAKAVEKVLADVPELRGAAPAGTGSAGNFARKTGEDPILAKIEKNILGA